MSHLSPRLLPWRLQHQAQPPVLVSWVVVKLGIWVGAAPKERKSLHLLGFRGLNQACLALLPVVKLGD